MRHNEKPGMVSAQEVACFTYCPEQWRLQYGFGLKPENQAALAAGIGRSKLTNALIEQKLGLRGTGRNWNTVLKLATQCR